MPSTMPKGGSEDWNEIVDLAQTGSGNSLVPIVSQDAAGLLHDSTGLSKSDSLAELDGRGHPKKSRDRNVPTPQWLTWTSDSH